MFVSRYCTAKAGENFAKNMRDTTQLLEVFRTIFLVAVSFGMMVAMNVKLSMIVLAFVPLVVIYSAVFTD